MHIGVALYRMRARVITVTTLNVLRNNSLTHSSSGNMPDFSMWHPRIESFCGQFLYLSAN